MFKLLNYRLISARTLGILRGHLDDAETRAETAEQSLEAANRETARFKQLLAEANQRTARLLIYNAKRSIQRSASGAQSPAPQFKTRLEQRADQLMVSRFVKIGPMWRRYAFASHFRRHKNAQENTGQLLDIVEQLVIADAANALDNTTLGRLIGQGREVLEEIYCPLDGKPAGTLAFSSELWQVMDESEIKALSTTEQGENTQGGEKVAA